MKNAFFLFLSLFLPISGFTQSGTKSYFYLKPVGFQVPAFDSKGYNPLFPETVTNLADQNPAALSDFKSMQTGISWRIFSKLEPDIWVKEFGQAQPLVPASAGFVYPVNSFVFGLGYSQKFNSSLFEEGELVTLEQPEGTGKNWTWEDETVHHYFSLSGAWKIDNILFGSDQFSAGVHLGFNQLFYQSKIFTSTAKSFPNGFSWAAGFQYLINFENESKIKSGLFFERGSKIEGTVKYVSGHDETKQYDEDTTGNNGKIPIRYLTPKSWPMIADFPDRLHGGFELTTPEKISFSLQGSYIWMDQTWRPYKNQLNVAGNVGIPITENLRVSGGFYSDTQNDNFSEFYYEIFKVKSSGYRSVFLTAGVNFVWQNYTFDLALGDNHLSSGEYRTQTHLKAGVSYKF
ncbi:MAG: hypothetical protein LCH54_08575 [Bacteroidetes bacterium]|nr:hypothetical protein [Bacteroidota bacterium]